MGGELILKLYILLIVNLFMQEYILCQMNEFKLACTMLCYAIPCHAMLYRQTKLSPASQRDPFIVIIKGYQKGFVNLSSIWQILNNNIKPH